MVTKTRGASLDKRRKCDAAFKAGALRLAGERSRMPAAARHGSRPKLLYRGQQAPLVSAVGSEAAAHDPPVRALRARPKRADQALDNRCLA